MLEIVFNSITIRKFLVLHYNPFFLLFVQSVGTMTLQVPGNIDKFALDDFLQMLLWEKTVKDAMGNVIEVLRLKV